MFKHIFIVFLCFVLLFLAFDSSYLKSESIFDTIDGHKQIFIGAPFEDVSFEEGDLILDPLGLYVFTSGGEDFSSADYKKAEDNALNDQIWDFLYNIDNKVHNVYNLDLFGGDGKIDVWFSSSDPLPDGVNPDHYCDLWYNSFTDSCAIYDGSTWFYFDDELVSTPYTGMPSFNDSFSFGYELTIGTFEVVASIFKGPDALFSRFEQWRVTLFGDVKLFDFVTKWISKCITILNDIAESLPVIGPLKRFIDSSLEPLEGFIDKVLEPLEDVFGNLAEWIRDKIR